jgi:hypothetical protein
VGVVELESNQTLCVYCLKYNKLAAAVELSFLGVLLVVILQAKVLFPMFIPPSSRTTMPRDWALQQEP